MEAFGLFLRRDIGFAGINDADLGRRHFIRLVGRLIFSHENFSRLTGDASYFFICCVNSVFHGGYAVIYLTNSIYDILLPSLIRGGNLTSRT